MKNNQSKVKLNTKQMILKALVGKPYFLREEIAERTHLAQSTLTSSLKDFENEGLIINLGPAAIPSGRPPIKYSLSSRVSKILCISLCAKEIDFSLLGPDCVPLFFKSYRVAENWSENFQQQVVSLFKEYSAEVELSQVSVLSICASGLEIIGSDIQFPKLKIALPKTSFTSLLPRPVSVLFFDEYYISLKYQQYLNGTNEGTSLYFHYSDEFGAAIDIPNSLSDSVPLLPLDMNFLFNTIILDKDIDNHFKPLSPSSLLIRDYCIIHKDQTNVPFYRKSQLSLDEILSMNAMGEPISHLAIQNQTGYIMKLITIMFSLFAPKTLFIHTPFIGGKSVSVEEFKKNLRNTFMENNLPEIPEIIFVNQPAFSSFSGMALFSYEHLIQNKLSDFVI